jgi:hypothetical protein
MIMTKLLILMAEPYDKKEVVFETSVAEFLVLRDLVYCNCSLLHLQTKMKSHMLKAYKEFYDAIVFLPRLNVLWLLKLHDRLQVC